MASEPHDGIINRQYATNKHVQPAVQPSRYPCVKCANLVLNGDVSISDGPPSPLAIVAATAHGRHNFKALSKIVKVNCMRTKMLLCRPERLNLMGFVAYDYMIALCHP